MIDRLNLSDNELIKRYLGGDFTSLEILINRHKDKVFFYILSNVKNQQLAEDLFQDTFIKVVKSINLGKYTEKGKFISWVMRIAHNIVVDNFRHENNLNTVSNDASEVGYINFQKYSDGTIEDFIVQEQIFNDVRELIEELPEDQRQVVIMRHFQNMSFKEIAEKTNVSINTSLGRMRYALIHLRRIIEEKGIILTKS